MDDSQCEVWKLILSNRMYQTGSMAPAEKQTLLLTLQQTSNSMRALINECCSQLVSNMVSKFGEITPEAWLARHGHLLAELHLGKDVDDYEQLAAIARGLRAANARPGGLHLQVFTGHTSLGMPPVLAELPGSSRHLTRLEVQHGSAELKCVEAVQELLPQLPQLKSLKLLRQELLFKCFPQTHPCRTISVAHLSHLTSLSFHNALVSSSEGLPSSLQQLQLDPVASIKPLMQLTGLRSLLLNIGWISPSSERQQLLEQLAAQCTSLREVALKYYDSTASAVGYDEQDYLAGGEMAAWALLPVCSLGLVPIANHADVQRFPHLLAATHKHLTELTFELLNEGAAVSLTVGLAQLTGLRKLYMNIGIIKFSSERQQLLEQLAAQCASLRELGLQYNSGVSRDYDQHRVFLKRGEMAAWALLPVCSLALVCCTVIERDEELFPQLLAATQQHLTALNFQCGHQVEVVQGLQLPVVLGQLTGLQSLHLSVTWSLAPFEVEQLLKVVASQLVNLRDLHLEQMHVSQAAMHHLSAARSLTYVNLNECSWDDGVDEELACRFDGTHLFWNSYDGFLEYVAEAAGPESSDDDAGAEDNY